MADDAVDHVAVAAVLENSSRDRERKRVDDVVDLLAASAADGIAASAVGVCWRCDPRGDVGRRVVLGRRVGRCKSARSVAQMPAGHGPGDQRPRRRPSAKNALARQRLIARLLGHLLLAAGEQSSRHSGDQRRPAATCVSGDWTTCSWRTSLARCDVRRSCARPASPCRLAALRQAVRAAPP